MAEDKAKTIESALLRIRDVLYVRVTLNQESQVESLHALTRSTRSAARICRDIQSVLNAQFGTEIESSKMSVAQIAGELETAIPLLRPRLHSVRYGIEGNEGKAQVNLEIEGKVVEGVATGGCSKSSRLRLVANATLNAVNLFTGDSLCCELEDVVLLPLSTQAIVVVTVRVSGRQKSESLTGSCIVRRDDLEAIARATLDSLNRRLPFYLKAEKR